MNKNIFISNFIVFILCVLLFSACQHDVEVIPIDQIQAGMQGSALNAVRPDCPNPIKLGIVSRKTDRVQNEYYAQVYRENRNVKAIVYSREYGLYIGLTIMPPPNVNGIEQDCSCKVGSFEGKSAVISISQPRNIVTLRGCPVCELGETCLRFFRG